MNFNELKLNTKLAHAVDRKGYMEPSEVQAKAIPVVLDGKDIIVQAQTGTGKTAAFGIPLLEKIAPTPVQIQALILTPTRELAVQVHKELSELAHGQGIFCLAVYGGASINIQHSELRRGQHIIIATPGRLMDMMRRGWISLNSLKYAVLDEADKMFDMGFRDDIDFILSKCPKERQTMLFSATIPHEIMALANKHLKHDKVFLNISQDNVAVDEIDQFFVKVDPKKRVSTVADLIKGRKMDKCLVFCRTQRTADWLSRELFRRGIRSRSIHGGLPQNARQRVLDDFRSDRTGVLIATDLLARGMDIKDISHIINFDFPKERETYVHRIGRTARFGKGGEAITFCTNVLELEELERIQDHIRAEIPELSEFSS